MANRNHIFCQSTWLGNKCDFSLIDGKDSRRCGAGMGVGVGGVIVGLTPVLLLVWTIGVFGVLYVGMMTLSRCVFCTNLPFFCVLERKVLLCAVGVFVGKCQVPADGGLCSGSMRRPPEEPVECRVPINIVILEYSYCILFLACRT